MILGQGALETCDVCKMRLPWPWGVSIRGVPAGRVWRCVMCAPEELCGDIGPTLLAGLRNDIINIRRERMSLYPGDVTYVDRRGAVTLYETRALASKVTGA